MELMAGLAQLRARLGGVLARLPLLVGPSRKGFLGRLTGACCQSEDVGSRSSERGALSLLPMMCVLLRAGGATSMWVRIFHAPRFAGPYHYWGGPRARAPSAPDRRALLGQKVGAAQPSAGGA